MFFYPKSPKPISKATAVNQAVNVAGDASDDFDLATGWTAGRASELALCIIDGCRCICAQMRHAKHMPLTLIHMPRSTHTHTHKHIQPVSFRATKAKLSPPLARTQAEPHKNIAKNV